jgi:hypothetical protein
MRYRFAPIRVYFQLGKPFAQRVTLAGIIIYILDLGLVWLSRVCYESPPPI